MQWHIKCNRNQENSFHLTKASSKLHLITAGSPNHFQRGTDDGGTVSSTSDAHHFRALGEEFNKIHFRVTYVVKLRLDLFLRNFSGLDYSRCLPVCQEDTPDKGFNSIYIRWNYFFYGT